MNAVKNILCAVITVLGALALIASAAAAPAVHESAAPPAAHAPASRLPSADMQHLMQVGGKILRE